MCKLVKIIYLLFHVLSLISKWVDDNPLYLLSHLFWHKGVFSLFGLHIYFCCLHNSCSFFFILFDTLSMKFWIQCLPTCILCTWILWFFATWLYTLMLLSMRCGKLYVITRSKQLKTLFMVSLSYWNEHNTTIKLVSWIS